MGGRDVCPDCMGLIVDGECGCTDTDKVVAPHFHRAVVDKLVEDLHDLLDSYAGRVSIAEAVGAIELAKLQALNERDAV